MNQAITEMLRRYDCKSSDDYKNALKEIMQEVALLGLARQNFFSKAAFYGGTALRIAHKLNRFSEDLDFTLLAADNQFTLNRYLKGIEDEFAALGLKLFTEKKEKSSMTSIDSAFLKSNTLQNLLLIEGLQNPGSGTNKNEMIKIKLEIDTTPPSPSGEVEARFLSQPTPFSYKILTLPSLFSGKLHALLCRDYGSKRIKGRDYFDYIWYKNRQVSPDLAYLKGKLVDSGHWKEDLEFSSADLEELLFRKFETTDWEVAKKDVVPFIKDSRELEVWSKDFFISLI